MNDASVLVSSILCGLLQIAKDQFKFVKKHVPLFSLVGGVLLMALQEGAFSREVILHGLEIGLAASGLQSGVAHYMKPTKPDNGTF